MKMTFICLRIPSLSFSSQMRVGGVKAIIDSEMNFHRHCSGLLAD